jgi:hypothetical protein
MSNSIQEIKNIIEDYNAGKIDGTEMKLRILSYRIGVLEQFMFEKVTGSVEYFEALSKSRVLDGKE